MIIGGDMQGHVMVRHLLGRKSVENLENRMSSAMGMAADGKAVEDLASRKGMGNAK
jgi:hypothetical protein